MFAGLDAVLKCYYWNFTRSQQRRNICCGLRSEMANNAAGSSPVLKKAGIISNKMAKQIRDPRNLPEEGKKPAHLPAQLGISATQSEVSKTATPTVGGSPSSHR
jgi:hypothetical protein